MVVPRRLRVTGDDQNRDLGRAQNRFGDAAQQSARDAASAVRSEDDEIEVVGAGECDDARLGCVADENLLGKDAV